MTRNNKIPRKEEFMPLVNLVAGKIEGAIQNQRIYGHVACDYIYATIQISDGMRLEIYAEDDEGGPDGKSEKKIPIDDKSMKTITSQQEDIMEMVYYELYRRGIRNYVDRITGERRIVIFSRYADYDY